MFDDLWLDPAPAATLRPPPAHLACCPGGRPVTVQVLHAGGNQLAMPGVVMAWARLPRERWAVLLVWCAYRSVGGKDTESARWAWVRYDERAMRPAPSPAPGNVWDHPWYGMIPDFEQAAAQASLTLPEPMRAAALRLHPRARVAPAPRP